MHFIKIVSTHLTYPVGISFYDDLIYVFFSARKHSQKGQQYSAGWENSFWGKWQHLAVFPPIPIFHLIYHHHAHFLYIHYHFIWTFQHLEDDEEDEDDEEGDDDDESDTNDDELDTDMLDERDSGDDAGW